MNDIINLNDPLLQYLSEDKIVDNERIITFEFPENFYFNLKHFDKMVDEGYYSSFTMDLNSDGSKIVNVIL